MATFMQNTAHEQTQETAHVQRAMSSRVQAAGRELARYGLVVVVAWIGLMKFTAYEAEGISRYVANSPLMSWVYEVMSHRGFSAVLGVVELTVAILIAARPFAPRASALGSALAVGMFLTTLSFLVTTPGVWAADAGGFPALSGAPGQFLLKDLALLGISLWSLGEAWQASDRQIARPG
jgi:uncharacterized membrane protein YkgB